jgi:hypothetical protein
MTHPSEEEFTAWRDDRVTKWVMSACQKAAEENKQAWLEKSWGSGVADQMELTVCRVRADAYSALHETNYTGWLATHEGEQ